jgi:hypothetical protein
MIEIWQARKQPVKVVADLLERRDDGSDAGRKASSQRASFIADTQRAAIERAREMGGPPLVERQRFTKGGSPDKWRKA